MAAVLPKYPHPTTGALSQPARQPARGGVVGRWSGAAAAGGVRSTGPGRLLWGGAGGASGPAASEVSKTGSVRGRPCEHLENESGSKSTRGLLVCYRRLGAPRPSRHLIWVMHCACMARHVVSGHAMSCHARMPWQWQWQWPVRCAAAAARRAGTSPRCDGVQRSQCERMARGACCTAAVFRQAPGHGTTAASLRVRVSMTQLPAACTFS